HEGADDYSSRNRFKLSHRFVRVKENGTRARLEGKPNRRGRAPNPRGIREIKEKWPGIDENRTGIGEGRICGNLRRAGGEIAFNKTSRRRVERGKLRWPRGNFS